MSTFEIVPDWHKKQSLNWQISGGPGVSAAWGLAGNAQVFRFTNKDLHKSYAFAYVGGGVGLAISADLGKFIGAVGQVTDQAANTYGNPLSMPGLDKTTVLRPFSFYDVVGALGGIFQASTSAIASVGAKFWQFGTRSGPFVRYEGPSIEAKLAVSVEPLNITGGALFPLDPEFHYVRKQEFVHMRDTKPSQNFRFHPGKI